MRERRRTHEGKAAQGTKGGRGGGRWWQQRGLLPTAGEGEVERVPVRRRRQPPRCRRHRLARRLVRRRRRRSDPQGTGGGTFPL